MLSMTASSACMYVTTRELLNDFYGINVRNVYVKTPINFFFNRTK
jgi:hypothetical protein